MSTGIVITPHCFLYGSAGDISGNNPATVEDEILSGWAVRILEDEVQGWTRIETHYGYQGYVQTSHLRIVDRDYLKHRDMDRRNFVMINAPEADILSLPKVQGSILETIPANSIVELVAEAEEGWSLVRSASDTKGYVHTAFLRQRKDSDRYLYDADASAGFFAGKAEEQVSALSKEDEQRFRRSVTESARRYLGTQYRWGGKSRQGIDCSGLAFMSYMENGFLIYRDAQIREGYPVREIKREELQEGDLIFFPGHVAVYLGDEKYIHSTGFHGTPCVTINSLNMHDTDYRDDLAHQITACGSVFGVSKGAFDESAEVCDEQTDMPDKANQSRFEWIQNRLESIQGRVSVYYKDLLSGTAFAYNTDQPLEAASIIKLYLMAAMFQGFEDGEFAPEDRIEVPRRACVPSCGVLTYLDDNKDVSLRDLVELMIIVSDNTACNVLLDFYGEERIQGYIREQLGLTRTLFQRKMFDSARAAQGLDNYTTASDTAGLLEKIYRGELVSREASRQMLQILEHQRLNGKIPFYLHAARPKPVIAHKTGENDGVTHDAAIFEGEKPFILIFMSNQVDVPEFEKLIGELSMEIYEKHQKEEI